MLDLGAANYLTCHILIQQIELPDTKNFLAG